MHFAFPLALVGLISIPLFIAGNLYARKKFALYGRIGSENGNTRSILFRQMLRFTLGSLALLFATFTIAEPRYAVTFHDPMKAGIDIAIVLDISKSMLAEDVEPNRIEAAKRNISEFVDSRNTDRIGLIVFAGKPFGLSPLTFDHDSLQTIIAKMGTESIRQELEGLSGTNIGDALLLALQNLKNAESSDAKREKIILLVTDGEANLGIDPRLVAIRSKEEWAAIYSIGIGSEKGVELYVTGNDGIKRPMLDASTGKPILSRVDGKLLRHLSDMTGGASVNASNKDELQAAFEKIDSLKKTELKSTEETRNVSLAPWFALLTALSALSFLIMEKRVFDSPYFRIW